MEKRDDEVLLVGSHCNFPSCNRVDFLPFKCGDCGSTFCLDHRSAIVHNCAPDLSTVRLADKSTTPTSLNAFVCDFDGCRQKEFNPVGCVQCNKNFCFSHRHPEDHDCKIPSSKLHTADEATSRSFDLPPSVNPPLAAPALKKALTPMALKVNAMKLKMNAVGESNILEANKIYLNVLLLDGSAKPVFVDSEWTFGRASESVKRVLKLNIKTESARLRDPSNNNPIPFNQPVKNVISSGSTLEFYT